MSASSRAPTRPRVSSFSRQVTTTKSDCAISSASGTGRAPMYSSSRRLGVRVGGEQFQVKNPGESKQFLPDAARADHAERAAGEARCP